MKDVNHGIYLMDNKKLQLKETLSILQTTLDSISDGVLVVSREGNIITFNQKFIELWSIPESIIKSRDDKRLLMFVKNQLKRPEDSFEFVNSEYENSERYINDILEFKDGKIFERYSQPQKIDNEIVGRICCFRDITEKNQIETALRENEALFRAAFEQAAVGIIHVNYDGRYLKVNQKFCNIVGYTDEELLKMNFMDISHPDDLKRDKRNVTDLIDGVINKYSVEKRYFKKDRSIVWVNLAVSLISQISANHSYVMGVVEDITERKLAEEAIKASENTFRALFEGSPDAIFIVEDNRVIDSNQAALELLGYSLKESIHGKNPWEFSPEKQPDGNLSEEKAIAMLNEVQVHGKAKFEWWHKKNDNSLVPVEILMTSILLNGKNVLHAICRDISDRKQMEQRLEYISYHDQLTGLYNRRFYEEELKRLDVERNLPLSIILGDVNGLKLINDSLGHALGDELIKKVAEVMIKGCRADDIIARLGGDEFVVLLPKTNVKEAEQIVNRIKSICLLEKVGSIGLSISFGWGTKNITEELIEDISKNVENNMYKEKLFESPSMRGKSVNAIISTLYEKSKSEELHSHRVSSLCMKMGKALNLSDKDISELKTVGLLHDIGKIAIDENLLIKKEKLTEADWKEMKRHPEIGYRILSTVNELSEMAEYVLAHHERWDGKGYPKGLKGKDIPYVARIIAITDSYDVMTNIRTNSKPLNEEDALIEIQKKAGTQFDPDIAKIFVEKVLNKSWN